MSQPAISRWTIIIETHQDELSPERRFWAVARAKRGPGKPDIETPIVTGETTSAAMANAIHAFANIIADKQDPDLPTSVWQYDDWRKRHRPACAALNSPSAQCTCKEKP